MVENTPQMIVHGELSGPLLNARLVHFYIDEPVDRCMNSSSRLRMDLSLTPRPQNARACYPQRWNTKRFEKLGKLFLVPPGEVMRAASDGICRQDSLLCEIDPEDVVALFEEEVEWSAESLRASLNIREPRIRSLLQRLAEEIRQPGFASDTLAEQIGTQLAFELHRYNLPPALKQQRGLTTWRLRLIDERLREDLSSPSVSELAEICGLSVRHLSRSFRVSRGCSLHDYVSAFRIAHARAMLASGQSVKAVALTLGFSSSSSFSYAFSRATGKTPSEWRAGFRLH